MKYTPIYLIIGAGLIAFPAISENISPLETLYQCSEIEDDSARLTCYDTAVGRTREAEQSGEFKTITRKEAEDVQKDAFGFSMPSLPKFSLPSFGSDKDDSIKKDESGQIEEVSLPIKSISEGGYGKLLIVFENGQVWRQSDSTPVKVSRKRPPTSAIIKRAALGSYLIKLDTGERFKARREE